MGLTDKTRKALWARSGNRCAICKVELIQKTEERVGNLILGEECHIISAKANGPRGKSYHEGNFNTYDNLILLCPNDHKKIDELTDLYTMEVLIIVKGFHEEWVKKTLEMDVNAFANDMQNVKSLPKITSGKQIIEIINGAHMFDFNHDELLTESEAELIGGLFEELKDSGDVLSEIGYAEVAKFGIHLNSQLEEVKRVGFVLFGIRREIRLYNEKKFDLGMFDTASLVAVRNDNPSIVDNYLIAKFPTNTKILL